MNHNHREEKVMTKATLFAAAAALLSVPAGVASATAEPAAAAELQMFDVAMTIFDGTRLVAQPRMRVAAGEPGRIVIEPGDGSHFRMDFSVTGSDAQALDFSSSLDAQSVAGDARTRMQATPRLILRAGQTGRIMLGDEGRGVGPYTADIMIRPVGNGS
jgi:hypothetical protein